MRLPLLVSAGVLLVALLPCPPCRALLARGPVPGTREDPQLPQPLDFSQPPPKHQQQPQAQPALLRTGEEYFLRQGNPDNSPAAPLRPASSPLDGRSGSRLSPDGVDANFFLAKLQQLLGRLRNSPADPAERGDDESALGGGQKAPARARRSEETPISLDLTFHLLREVLELAKAEQLAQQAQNNRKLMEMVGK